MTIENPIIRRMLDEQAEIQRRRDEEEQAEAERLQAERYERARIAWRYLTTDQEIGERLKADEFEALFEGGRVIDERGSHGEYAITFQSPSYPALYVSMTQLSLAKLGWSHTNTRLVVSRYIGDQDANTRPILGGNTKQTDREALLAMVAEAVAYGHTPDTFDVNLIEAS